MTTSLLTTKFYIPRIDHPRGVVARPRLMERLDEGLDRKMSLVSAPAGYGKTTLVGGWAHRVGAGRDAPLQVAWLSLDENDNDPTRFLSYVVAALRTAEVDIATGALSALQSPQPPPAEAILTALINEIAALPGRVLLVLDDYHLIEAQPVHEAVRFLLRHLPPVMHLVIATRDDPPLPLARLRARRHMTELRAADLRFSSSEAAEFLNRVMGLELSEEDIAALERRTEGWIAGLQLAAVSMQRRTDVTGFIQSFTGSHRFVLDYLVEEILEQQSEEVQAFLLRTSILDRLSGPLCDAVLSGGAGEPSSSQGTAGQVILEALERANLFIAPLDDQRRWYRYHHLFADLLRQRLRQTQPEQLPTLHALASEWYRQNGLIDDAIEHVLKAKDPERTVRLLEEHVDAIWGRGEHAKLRRWLGSLPPESVCARPHLCICHAWYSFVSGQGEAAEQSLQAAENALDPRTDLAPEFQPQEQNAWTSTDAAQLRGRIAAIRAFMNSHRGDVALIVRHAQQALEHLPEADQTWRGLTAMTLGDVHGFNGDMNAAYEARAEALAALEVAGVPYYIMLAGMKVAITLRSQGRLRRTVEICQRLIQSARESGLSEAPLNGLLLMILAEVLVELNGLDEVPSLVTKGMERIERGVDQALVGWGYICLMRILFSRGEAAVANQMIQEMESIAQESNVPPWITSQLTAWRTRLWLADDRLEEASQWAVKQGFDTDGGVSLPREIRFFTLFDYILYARILIAQGRFDESMKLLEGLLEAAEAGGRLSRVIEILLLQAISLHSQNGTDQAIAILGKALTLAEPEGFIRVFVDEGRSMVRLLHAALSRDIAPDYVRRLLAAFPLAEPDQTDTSESRASDSVLIEPLSEREIEVLQLIAAGMTNPEIATRLFLSPHTVKAHTRNIYGKLGVHNRMEAAARAGALGVLPPT